MKKLRLIFILVAVVSIFLLVGVATPLPLLAQKTERVTSATWDTAGNVTDNNQFLGTINKKPLVFKTKNKEQMRILPNGNVGIGLPKPNAKLAVAGLIESTSAGFKFPDGTIQSTAATGGGGGNYVSRAGDTMTGALNLPTNGMGVGGSQLVAKNGNVGIGTNDPKAKLQINAPAAGDGLRLQGIADGAANVAYATFNDSAGAQTGWVGDGSEGNFDTFLASVNGGVTLRTKYGNRVILGDDGVNRILTNPVGISGEALRFMGDDANHKGGSSNRAYLSFYDIKQQRVGLVGDVNINDETMYVTSDHGSVEFIANATGDTATSLTVTADGRVLTQGANVGIGTLNPQARLHILKHDEAFRLQGGGVGSLNRTFMSFADQNGNFTGFMGDLRWQDNAVHLMSTKGDVVLTACSEGDTDCTAREFRVSKTGTVSFPALKLTGGADLAENFHSTDTLKPEPGTVMVIDEVNEGKLKTSTTAYDKKVAGIVSGAGSIKTGITLQQEGVLEGDVPVTVVGRVNCKAEASNGAIQPGDLLTTSTLPGYCMKASDNARANGAIIGKAMTGLKSGKGLVLVLVNLQ